MGYNEKTQGREPRLPTVLEIEKVIEKLGLIKMGTPSAQEVVDAITEFLQQKPNRQTANLTDDLHNIYIKWLQLLNQD